MEDNNLSVIVLNSLKVNEKAQELKEEAEKYLPTHDSEEERNKFYFEKAEHLRKRKLIKARKLASSFPLDENIKKELKSLLNIIRIEELWENYLVSEVNKNIIIFLKNDSNLSPGKVYEVNIVSESLDKVIKRIAELIEIKKPAFKTNNFQSEPDYIPKKGEKRWYRFNERGEHGDLKSKLDDTRSVIMENSSNIKKGIHYVKILNKYNGKASIFYFGKLLDSLTTD